MPRAQKLNNDDALEMVRVCGPTEAPMIQELLRNNGIDSTLQGELAGNTIPATSDLDEVRIWVRTQDAAAARDLIDAFFTPVSKEDLREPATGLGVEDPEEPGGFTV